MKTITLTAIIKKPYTGNEKKVDALYEALAYYNREWCNKGQKIYYEISCDLMLKEIRNKVLTLFKKRLVILVKANGTTIN